MSGIEEGKPASSEYQGMTYSQLSQLNSQAAENSPPPAPEPTNTNTSPEGGSGANNEPPPANTRNPDGSSEAAKPDSKAVDFDFSQFQELTGREFSSLDDLKGYVQELKESQSKFVNPDEIPEQVRQHWDLIKNGKSSKDFYKELAADYENMDDMSVMLESEMRKEQNQGRDRELVKKKLERDLRQKFREIDRAGEIKNLSDDDLQEYMDDNNLTKEEIDDILIDGELAQKEIEEMATSARNSLTESQKKLLEASTQAPEKTLDPQTEAFLREHKQTIEKAVEKFGSATFEVAEDGSLSPYTLSLNGANEAETKENQQRFMEYMEDPWKDTQKRMTERFINKETGKLDYEGLSKFYFLLDNFDKFPQKITAHVSNQANISTIEREKRNPASSQQNGTAVTKSPNENWMAAAAKAREAMGY